MASANAHVSVYCWKRVTRPSAPMSHTWATWMSKVSPVAWATPRYRASMLMTTSSIVVLHPVASAIAFIAAFVAMAAGFAGSLAGAIIAFMAWVLTIVAVALGLGSNYDARLRSVVDGHDDLAPLRGRVVISAAVGFRKPAAEFFAEVMRVAGCEPGEILFVGDDVENDYEGATAAGLRAVLLEPRRDFVTPPAAVERRIASLAELIG